MRVAVGRQTKVANLGSTWAMSDVLATTHQLHQGEGDLWKIRGALFAHLVDELRERERAGRGRKRNSVLGGVSHNPGPSLRLLHNSSNRGERFRIEGSGHRAIGSDHQLLD